MFSNSDMSSDGNLWHIIDIKGREKKGESDVLIQNEVNKTPSSPYLTWEVAFNWWKSCNFAYKVCNIADNMAKIIVQNTQITVI